MRREGGCRAVVGLAAAGATTLQALGRAPARAATPCLATGSRLSSLRGRHCFNFVTNVGGPQRFPRVTSRKAIGRLEVLSASRQPSVRPHGPRVLSNAMPTSSTKVPGPSGLVTLHTQVVRRAVGVAILPLTRVRDGGTEKDAKTASAP